MVACRLLGGELLECFFLSKLAKLSSSFCPLCSRLAPAKSKSVTVWCIQVFNNVPNSTLSHFTTPASYQCQSFKGLFQCQMFGTNRYSDLSCYQTSKAPTHCYGCTVGSQLSIIIVSSCHWAHAAQHGWAMVPTQRHLAVLEMTHTNRQVSVKQSTSWNTVQ